MGRIDFYARGVLRDLVPYPVNAYRLRRLFARLEASGLDPDIIERVNYYNKIAPGAVLQGAVPARSISDEGSYYLYDLREHLNFFSGELLLHRQFGDVTNHLRTPGFAKTRPLAGNNQNSVLLKLDKLRHFKWPRDPYAFESKRKTAVWRGALHSQVRLDLVKKFHSHPRHDIGHTGNEYDGVKPKTWVSSYDQLRHRYVLSIEGVDVATNLKMVLASQSICLMPKPRYESWLMEGKLGGGVHYVELRDDFSDIEEKIEYLDRHEDEATAIVANANRYMKQFDDEAREHLISILVLQKYFENTGQVPAEPIWQLRST